MKSRVWYIWLCAVLVLVASPTVFSDTYTVPDGGDTGYGSGGGYGWGPSAIASASANGSTPFSWGAAWGSVTLYATEAGYYTVGYSCSADAYANYTANDTSEVTAAGGGSGSTPWGSASVTAGVSNGGQIGAWQDDPPADGGVWGSDNVWLDAYGSISVSCEAQAGASAAEGYDNFGYGEGSGNADID